MGRVHTELGELMLEMLTELPATQKVKIRKVCNNTILRAVPKSEDHKNHSVVCELHGHKIAEVWNSGGGLSLRVSLCGNATHTTKNRLSGVFSGITKDRRLSIFTKDGSTYLSTWISSVALDHYASYVINLRFGKVREEK